MMMSCSRLSLRFMAGSLKEVRGEVQSERFKHPETNRQGYEESGCGLKFRDALTHAEHVGVAIVIDGVVAVVVHDHGGVEAGAVVFADGVGADRLVVLTDAAALEVMSELVGDLRVVGRGFDEVDVGPGEDAAEYEQADGEYEEFGALHRRSSGRGRRGEVSRRERNSTCRQFCE